MPDQPLDIVVFYETEDDSLASLVAELDELEVPYDEVHIAVAEDQVIDELRSAGGGELVTPTVSVNGQMLVRPTSALVMSTIMHARAGGFYQ